MFDKAFNDLIEYLKSWEEFRDTPYYATEDERKRGILTIGYGFAYPENHCPQTMTQEEALIKLNKKIDKLKTQLLLGLARTNFSINIYEWDALISLMFNLGINGAPQLMACIANKDNAGALDQFYDGIYQSKNPILGLIYRRASDAQIFENGIYQKRDYITPIEKERFLRMNAKNKEAIDMINNRVKVQL